jgi:hypothetical protein
MATRAKVSRAKAGVTVELPGKVPALVPAAAAQLLALLMETLRKRDAGQRSRSEEAA